MIKVITYGTFDLFHQGHYRLLKRAKELGDYLIVGVTTEAYDKTRGKLNVVDSLVTRIENVKKAGFADEIIIEESQGQKINDIRRFHVDIFAIGSDWTGAFDYLSDYCRVVYLERTKNISSTMLREKNDSENRDYWYRQDCGTVYPGGKVSQRRQHPGGIQSPQGKRGQICR